MSRYNYKRILRFVAVGGSNALLHFTILNICFFVLSQPKIASSIIATIFTVIYSFFLNRNYVFRNSDKTRRKKQASRFVAVTLFGMLFIHNTVFVITSWYLENYGSFILSFLLSIVSVNVSVDFININLATVAGAIVAMLWNYNGYRFFVFRQEADNSAVVKN